MPILTQNIDRRRCRARVQVDLAGLRCRWACDWSQRPPFTGAAPFQVSVDGVELGLLRFGFHQPWRWTTDLDAVEVSGGAVLRAQGYERIEGGRLPFLRLRWFLFRDPAAIYEIAETHHLGPSSYTIAGVLRDEVTVAANHRRAHLVRDGVTLYWQFSAPIATTEFGKTLGQASWVLTFAEPGVEALLQWNRGEAPDFPVFTSLTGQVRHLSVTGPDGERALDAEAKHDCIGPGERLHIGLDTLALPGPDASGAWPPGLHDLVMRRIEPGSLAVGAARVFSLQRLAVAPSMPMLKPSLVRALRSLDERRCFNVVPEDDPTQPYNWGTGSWPRCFSILSLDAFGRSDAAFGYLQWMLDVSRQFEDEDGLAHLWDSFLLTGERRGDALRDLNGHGIKLYEAGRFYRRHRGDAFGEALRTEHYPVLRAWAAWIERHVDDAGLVLDRTESNRWAEGYGAFTQAPCAAGLHLLAGLAADAGHEADAARLRDLARRLVAGLHAGLVGDAENRSKGVPAGIGRCFTTYLPAAGNPRDLWEYPVQGLGLSCYSLAPHYFLQDPEVGLLASDDPVAVETLDLALSRLGDPVDDRIITWHLGRHPAHLGYGQGQILQALLYAGRKSAFAAAFRERLAALFDCSTKEPGDPYLMQEVLGRPQPAGPNRGNKAHLTYYPVLIDSLLRQEELGLPPVLPDLRAVIA